jgi:hypothetical protein
LQWHDQLGWGHTSAFLTRTRPAILPLIQKHVSHDHSTMDFRPNCRRTYERQFTRMAKCWA